MWWHVPELPLRRFSRPAAATPTAAPRRPSPCAHSVPAGPRGPLHPAGRPRSPLAPVAPCAPRPLEPSGPVQSLAGPTWENAPVSRVHAMFVCVPACVRVCVLARVRVSARAGRRGRVGRGKVTDPVRGCPCPTRTSARAHKDAGRQMVAPYRARLSLSLSPSLSAYRRILARHAGSQPDR